MQQQVGWLLVFAGVSTTLLTYFNHELREFYSQNWEKKLWEFKGRW